MEPIGVAKLIPDNFGQWNETVSVDPHDKLFAELKFWSDLLQICNFSDKSYTKIHKKVDELIDELLPDVSHETSPEAEGLKEDEHKAPIMYFTNIGQ